MTRKWHLYDAVTHEKNNVMKMFINQEESLILIVILIFLLLAHAQTFDRCVAPRALVFRPLGKGNKGLGTRLGVLLVWAQRGKQRAKENNERALPLNALFAFFLRAVFLTVPQLTECMEEARCNQTPNLKLPFSVCR